GEALPPIVVSIDRARSAQLFHIANEKFEASFHLEKLRPLVESLARGEVRELSKDEEKELKTARKDANVLRTTFQLFGDKHEPPKQLDEFVTAFGRLNDAIDVKEKHEAVKQDKRLLKALDSTTEMRAAIATFAPASRESFDAHVENLFSELQRGLSHD